jgi:hypothetical protein
MRDKAEGLTEESDMIRRSNFLLPMIGGVGRIFRDSARSQEEKLEYGGRSATAP